MNVYPFIESEKVERRNVKRACELLQVSRAAYYADRRIGPSRREPVLIAQLSMPDADVEAVLGSAVSCVVTKAEHELLSRFDKTFDGWDRYVAARVHVYDMSTGDLLIKNGQYV